MKTKNNFTTDLHLCCGSDDIRKKVEYVYFFDGYVYATDGCVLIKQSLEFHNIIDIENINGKRLHWKAFKEIRKRPQAICTETGIKCITGYGAGNYVEYGYGGNDDETMFSVKDFEAVLKRVPAKFDGPVTFAINPKLLYNIYSAFSGIYDGQGLKLTPSENYGAIIVEPNNCLEYFQQAIIMPCMVFNT